MRNQRTLIGHAAVLLVATASLAQTATARGIDCNKGFQRVQGDLIATPYCQDTYLADVAREYGVSASAERIRQNPNYKREVCRIAGQDIRAQAACVDEVSPGRSGRF